ncbi:hypothetical protein N0V91_006113 [Didymella pomorum]|uniref:Uncharacterized protein n=1 Tax=Didymella pomorum TaxID=749634 RepID=A0A9W8ZF75_9PLEO|nr:hypothetical protein N0V91_006113 [Didymella pomorum]
MDTKIAIWHSLLPPTKRDPLRQDGTVDEVMFQAHMIGAIVFSMAISAQIATAQVASCNLLEDHALSIARDRVRLSIGFLSAMGSIWPVGKAMAKDVRAVARSVVSEPSSLPLEQQESIDEVEIPRDELIWPVDPSANVDIYSGLVLPMDWEQITIGHSGYASSALIPAATFRTSAPGDYGS